MGGHLKTWVSLFVAALLWSCTVSPTIPPEIASLPLLNTAQKSTLAGWLRKNPNFRIATEKDCDCDNDIRYTRKKGTWGGPMPTYEPYLSVGDFNHDGKQDFAALVVDIRQTKRGMLLIFNGPFETSTKAPVFSTALNFLSHVGIFQSYRDHELILGPFESEGCVYEPKGNTYVEDCTEDD